MTYHDFKPGDRVRVTSLDKRVQKDGTIDRKDEKCGGGCCWYLTLDNQMVSASFRGDMIEPLPPAEGEASGKADTETTNFRRNGGFCSWPACMATRRLNSYYCEQHSKPAGIGCACSGKYAPDFKHGPYACYRHDQETPPISDSQGAMEIDAVSLFVGYLRMSRFEAIDPTADCPACDYFMRSRERPCPQHRR